MSGPRLRFLSLNAPMRAFQKIGGSTIAFKIGEQVTRVPVQESEGEIVLVQLHCAGWGSHGTPQTRAGQHGTSTMWALGSKSYPDPHRTGEAIENADFNLNHPAYDTLGECGKAELAGIITIVMFAKECPYVGPLKLFETFERRSRATCIVPYLTKVKPRYRQDAMPPVGRDAPFGAASSLPVELFDRILQQALYPRDPVHRAQAGLVNTAFRQLTLPTAFYSISCGHPSSFTRSIRQWNYQLSAHPNIACCVRAIRVNGPVLGPVPQLRRLIMLCSDGFTLHTILFSEVNLDAITESHVFNDIVSPFSTIILSGRCIVTDMQVARILSGAPCLEEVRLGDTEDHIEFRALNDLQLVAQHGCTTSSIRRISVALSPDSDAGLLRVLACLQRVAGWCLTTLHLDISGEASVGAKELIETASRSLVRLDLIISHGLMSDSAFSLRTCDQLEIVTLHFNYEDTHVLIAIIQSIPRTHFLKYLNIHIDVQEPDMSGWSELGHHLRRTGLHDISILLFCDATNALDWEMQLRMTSIVNELNDLDVVLLSQAVKIDAGVNVCYAPQGLVFANRAESPHLVYCPRYPLCEDLRVIVQYLPTRTSGRHAPKLHNLHLDYYVNDAYRQLLSFRADSLRVHKLFTTLKKCYYIAICPLQHPFNWVNYQNAKNDILTRFLPKTARDVESLVWFGNVVVFKTEQSFVVDIAQEDIPQVVNAVASFTNEYLNNFDVHWTWVRAPYRISVALSNNLFRHVSRLQVGKEVGGDKSNGRHRLTEFVRRVLFDCAGGSPELSRLRHILENEFAVDSPNTELPPNEARIIRLVEFGQDGYMFTSGSGSGQWRRGYSSWRNVEAAQPP
ncbi:hypothetical protein BDZ89DRAFT_1036918 [Hymenopellis radicata]|nr:hypothetical protein BDZ89DRAFT_1036918 [Hymenopellis radicata]